MPHNFRTITDKPTLDAATHNAISHPTLLYIHNSSLPSYGTFTSILEEVLLNDAANHEIGFYYMDYCDTTSSLMKFAPNQMPVLVAMYGENWCRTILGADRKGIEGLILDLKEQARDKS